MTALASPDSLVAEMAARCRFPESAEVTCAVSGGPDSMALLVLACASGRKVTAVHVDHGLREGSAAEADVVDAACRRFGAHFVRTGARVGVGPNLEARARAARLALLPADALFGHTADDQAETVLLNLLRGSGLDGLAGIRSDRRPLLALRRADTHQLCTHLEITVVSDPSNLDPSIRRNRVRHELLPLIDDIAQRDVSALLARNAGHMRDDADLLNELARALDPQDCLSLRMAPPALARRALRQWLTDADGYVPDTAAIDRVMAVVHGEVRACELPNHRRVRRSHQRLELISK